MRRIISIWLPHWPIDRWTKAKQSAISDSQPTNRQVIGSQTPAALVYQDANVTRLYAVCPHAAHMGVAKNMTLAEARAIAPTLLTAPANPAGDARALEQLARWAVRYSPLVSIDGNDGLFIDATGCSHLFGGEEEMLADIRERLEKAGIHACLAMADTPGAAWALAHYRGANTIATPNEEGQVLARLPVKALRLDDATVTTLNRLGLKTIGTLTALERPALARRFKGMPSKAVSDLLAQLDRALGKRPEPITPLLPLPAWQVRQAFMEPVNHLHILENAVTSLIDDLCIILQEAEQGIRRLKLTAFRVDGSITACEIGTSRASRDSRHLMKLLAEKLTNLDAGFGVDLILLTAFETAPLSPVQLGDKRQTEMASAAELMDRLAARLGAAAVSKLKHHPSHLPEKNQRLVSAETNQLGWEEWRSISTKAPRPLRLLPKPETIDVLAEVPEGPPKSFRWRRVVHRVAKAEGPERISNEWWYGSNPNTRDYYRVEDDNGVRFWLFRHGLYAVPGVRAAETENPAWYIHGLFA